MRDLARIVANVLVALHLRAGRHLALDPLLEGARFGDLARRLDAVHERRGVVALGVGEVAEVERGLDGRVRARQVQAAPGPRARDVGRHAKGHAVGDLFVAQTLRVEGERDLVAVHHDVGDIAVGQGRWVGGLLVGGRVGLLAAEEDAGVRVHGRLALRHGLVELPHDDGLGVVLQILAHTGNVLHDGDVQGLELILGAQTREEHEARGVDGAGGENGLGAGVDAPLGAVAQGDLDALDGAVVHVDLGDPGVGQHGQVGPVLLAAQDGVDVGDRGGGAAVVVGVVRDVEEADALLEGARLGDLLVVVGDDGDVHGIAAGEHPVLAQGVAVAGVHGLDGVAQLVHQTHEVGERPPLGAERLPDLQVVLKGPEGDERVVRGAATQHLGA